MTYRPIFISLLLLIIPATAPAMSALNANSLDNAQSCDGDWSGVELCSPFDSYCENILESCYDPNRANPLVNAMLKPIALVASQNGQESDSREIQERPERSSTPFAEMQQPQSAEFKALLANFDNYQASPPPQEHETPACASSHFFPAHVYPANFYPAVAEPVPAEPIAQAQPEERYCEQRLCWDEHGNAYPKLRALSKEYYEKKYTKLGWQLSEQMHASDALANAIYPSIANINPGRTGSSVLFLDYPNKYRAHTPWGKKFPRDTIVFKELSHLDLYRALGRHEENQRRERARELLVSVGQSSEPAH